MSIGGREFHIRGRRLYEVEVAVCCRYMEAVCFSLKVMVDLVEELEVTYELIIPFAFF